MLLVPSMLQNYCPIPFRNDGRPMAQWKTLGDEIQEKLAKKTQKTGFEFLRNMMFPLISSLR